MKKIQFHGISFVGRRKNNEDAIMHLQINKTTWCFAVADGMGGAEGGEIASKQVLESLEDTLNGHFKGNKPKVAELKPLLERAIDAAQKKIGTLIDENPGLAGMGTTLTVLLVSENNYAWANIGDSRIYQINSEGIRQITEDHTYIEQYRQEHDNEVPEFIAKQYGNIITRAIGGNDDVPDLFPKDKDSETLEPGTLFLLCSDGLITTKATDVGKDFIPYISKYKSLEKAVEQLVSKAFYEGSSDNISAILVQYGQVKRGKIKNLPVFPYPPKDKPPNSKPRGTVLNKIRNKLTRFAKDPLKLLALLLFGGLVAASYLYLKPISSNGENTTKPKESTGLPAPPVEERDNTDDSTEDLTQETTKEMEFEADISKLSSVRKKSLRGMLELFVKFLQDEKVREKNLSHPLDGLFKEVMDQNPENRINLKYYSNDSLRPAGQNGEGYYEEKSKYGELVSIHYSDFENVSQNSGDYATNVEVFARESGLNGLTILLSRLVISYLHPEVLFDSLRPLLAYMAIYNNDEKVNEHSFGTAIEDGFAQKAKKTKESFYIQYLQSDGNYFIDICVPTGDKGQVLRLGYNIN